LLWKMLSSPLLSTGWLIISATSQNNPTEHDEERNYIQEEVERISKYVLTWARELSLKQDFEGQRQNVRVYYQLFLIWDD
jgi:hypothetical protein